MKTKLTSPAAATVDMGTGNVFADLGLPDPDERQLPTSWEHSHRCAHTIS